MSGPKLVLVWELGDSGFNPIDPGFGNRPIHHPGHPDHGLPSRPTRPDQGLPGEQPGPDNSLPPGGETIPPDQISNELPEPPPPYNEKTVVAVKQPGKPWVYKSYDADLEIDNELPPAPTPKQQRRR